MLLSADLVAFPALVAILRIEAEILLRCRIAVEQILGLGIDDDDTILHRVKGLPVEHDAVAGIEGPAVHLLLSMLQTLRQQRQQTVDAMHLGAPRHSIVQLQRAGIAVSLMDIAYRTVNRQ